LSTITKGLCFYCGTTDDEYHEYVEGVDCEHCGGVIEESYVICTHPNRKPFKPVTAATLHKLIETSMIAKRASWFDRMYFRLCQIGRKEK